MIVLFKIYRPNQQKALISGFYTLFHSRLFTSMIDCLYTFLWFWTFSCNDNKISPDKKYEGGVPLCYPHKQVTSPPCQPTHRLRRTCHVLMLPVLASLHPLCLPTKQETHYSDVLASDMPTLSVPFLAASQGAVYSSSAAAHALSYFFYWASKERKTSLTTVQMPC